MKNNEMAGVFNFLQKVPVNRLEPKQIRNRIVTLHLALRKELIAVDKEVNEKQKEMFSGKEDRMGQYTDLVNSIQLAKTVAERDAIVTRLKTEFAAEKELDAEFGKVHAGIMERESRVKFDPFKIDEFFNAMTKVGAEITGRDLTAISPVLAEK